MSDGLPAGREGVRAGAVAEPVEPSGSSRAAGGRYEVVRRLAVGGMGEIFLALDRHVAGISRPVVIKRLLPELAEDPAQIALFLDEARIATILAHPNIVHVHEVGRDALGYFIAMEYVPGPSLSRLCERARRDGLVMPRHVAVHVVAELARALHHAHTARDAGGAPLALIHRDVSPHNVLLSGAGDVKLADFGIAHAAVRRQRTRTGVVRGKPAYMAPEQLERAEVGVRSDVFAAGVVLWEVTLDRNLFDAERDVELIAQVRAADIPSPRAIDPSYPDRLEAVVMTALARDPAARFATAAELEAALRAAVPARGDERRLLGRMVERLFPELASLDRTPAVDLARAQTEELPAPPTPPEVAPPSSSRSSSSSTSSSSRGPDTALARPRRSPLRSPLRRRAVAAGLLVVLGVAAAVVVRRVGERPQRAAAAVVAAPHAGAASPWPLPASAVEPLVASGACDSDPVVVDGRTLVYRHRDRAGIDLRVRDLVTGADRALTATPDVEELSPQPAIGERAIIALPHRLGTRGAGPARIDLDTGAVAPLRGGAEITFGPGAFTVGDALYYVLGGGSQFVRLRDGVADDRATFAGRRIGSMTVDPRGRSAALLTGGHVCLLELAGSAAPRCLTDLDEPYGRVGLDERGRIYYAGTGGLHRRDPATGEDVVLVAGRGANGGLAVSAAGDAVLFSECQPYIEITRVADGTIIQAGSLTRAQQNRRGAWTFVRETPSASLLAFLDPEGIVHLLTQAEEGLATEPALEPDGDRIVFYLSSGERSGLYLAEGQSHTPIRRLSRKELSVSIWIDDRHVAASLVHDDGRPYVHVVDVDTGLDRQALPYPRLTVDRQPDGDVVLLASEDRTRLFLWEPARGRERELSLPRELAGSLVSDAELGAGVRSVDLWIGPELWTVPIDRRGRGGTPIHGYRPPAGTGFYGLEIGADDRRYVMVSEPRGDLYRLRLPR